jgi:hypothetical protein
MNLKRIYVAIQSENRQPKKQAAAGIVVNRVAKD